ncbi:hypothetical protein ACN9MH_07585 [Paenibacillus silvae]|uniref:hypothetical protein n=1 Tax=Paenibacillus TaxID=44249 RepID=UPI001C1078D6|nr:hypothetical protein [Paenibacillus barcinonensis]MBU5353862.1 hypothetical protein [Paenibacillus barcinonensis]
MIVQDLRNWASKHNIKNRALESFWLNLKSYRLEEPEEFEELFWNYDEKYLKILIENISLHIKSLEYIDPNNKELEYIEVKVRIEYRANHIGYYRIFFGMDGEIEDDIFISEWTGLRLYQTRALLEDIKEEIETDRMNGEITEKEAIKLKAIIEVKKEKIRKELSHSE